MSFQAFKDLAHTVFVDANERAGEIPDLVVEILTLQNDRDVVLSELVERAREPRSLQTISTIKLLDNSLTESIISLANSIGKLRNRLLDVSNVTRTSLQSIGDTSKLMSSAQHSNDERKAVVSEALASIQIDFSVREFSVGAVLIQLYSVISFYRDVHLSFLRRKSAQVRVKEAAVHLGKAALEDVAHHFLPFLGTATALWTEVVTSQIEHEIAALAGAMNEFERIFLLERTLGGLSEYARQVRQLVDRADRDIDEDKKRIIEATAAIKQETGN
jgi:hypothetical protein